MRDRLVNHYSAESIFMDIDNIPLGVDFREYVARTLENADIVLAIIGRKWAGGTTKQKTRIFSSTDPLRIEIEKAFEFGIPVLPVLVDGATMPDPDKLPESLKELPFRNAAIVDNGRDFHPHIDRLIRSMDLILEKSSSNPSVEGSATREPAVPALARMRASPHSKRGQLAAVLARYRNALAAAGFCGVVGVMAFLLLGVRQTPQVSENQNKIIPSTNAAQAAPIDCKEERNLRSLATTVPTSMVFTNKGEKTVRLYWLNHNGARVLYGTLDRFQTVSQQTFVTHPWVVTDTKDECKAIYMPAAQRMEIAIVI
jgi:hypothetical protein